MSNHNQSSRMACLVERQQQLVGVGIGSIVGIELVVVD